MQESRAVSEGTKICVVILNGEKINTKGKYKMTNYKSDSSKRTATKTKQRRVDKWVEKVKSRR